VCFQKAVQGWGSIPLTLRGGQGKTLAGGDFA
jgi:hypothetical protein